MDKKITNTIDAQIITILRDYCGYSGNAEADAMLEIKATILAEIEKAQPGFKESSKESIPPWKLHQRAGFNKAIKECREKVRELLR